MKAVLVWRSFVPLLTLTFCVIKKPRPISVDSRIIQKRCASMAAF
ncbi:hypothetical protein D1BOALGB6SA_619 [Olavius sp. associated proteobacterium Delta 1]|nr:hypothetical protein D1BOALGB6SA_619 [Olavius sp. associated proteobacterium Delta 1]